MREPYSAAEAQLEGMYKKAVKAAAKLEVLKHRISQGKVRRRRA